MSTRLTCTIYVSLGFLVAAVGFHITGFLTNIWFTGTSDNQSDGIISISIGLWKQKLEYRNGTLIEEDSKLNIREEHYIMLAEASTNFLLCFIVLFKQINVCVGIIAFINMTLLLLSAFYSFVHLGNAKEDLQEIFLEWPNLIVSWSFYFVWAGILVNILATGAFLSALLIKGERKAANSSKGLGPVPQTVFSHIEEEKIVKVSTVSNDNYGYSTDVHHKYAYSCPGTSYHDSNHEHVAPAVTTNTKETENRGSDSTSIKPEDIEVPGFEQEEPSEPFYIGRINADDAENLEFGYGVSESEFPDTTECEIGSLPKDDVVTETSRL